MGLKFIVSEAQARSSQATQVSSQAQQAVSSLQQSFQQFLSAPLSSKAYDSAKIILWWRIRLFVSPLS
ncbi:hypothetical protein IGJ55_002987 [Enterococcus sp. AZ170]|uniref:hypothetical protein n=1 Tax=Enterococcus TaxID=1350 RepID=UPI001A932310|nr:hypothetical protein [Enterococcus ureilyticus]MBO0447408.1 hypothetical protein [Enterococcus ureilyticus]